MTPNAQLSRREFVRRGLVLAGGVVSAPSILGAERKVPAPKLAVCTASYMIRSRLKGDAPAGFRDSVHFLEHCRALGAGGIQTGVGDWDRVGRDLRAKAEAFGMALEGQIGLPRGEADLARFESQLARAREAGATIVRTAMLGGRRYETFKTVESWREFRERSWDSLVRAEPVLRRQKIRLALENHKDWRIEELLKILERISSEFVGVNLDTGNNLALLEEPMAVVEALAPHTISIHIKDMGVREYAEGFLLSEVPLGDGFLDLPRIIAVCRRTRPDVQFNLEMITRDPLKIPCLTDAYWTTMDSVRAGDLAKVLRLVRTKVSAKPLPSVAGMDLPAQLAYEEANNRRSFEWWRRQFGR